MLGLSVSAVGNQRIGRSFLHTAVLRSGSWITGLGLQGLSVQETASLYQSCVG